MLQLVLGRSGYGKTKYVQQKISEDILNGTDGVLLLVPEQFSFVTGNTYLSYLGANRYKNLEITDFTRLANELKNKFGGPNRPALDKGGKAVLMSRAIHAVQDNLKLYTKKLTSASFIHSVLEMQTELKCCNVQPQALCEAAEKVDKTTFQHKMHDISLIINAYEALVADRFLDSADDLTRLYDTLLQNDYLKGRHIYIDGFDGYTAQELKIIERMLLDAALVTITLPTDTISAPADDYSAFANVRRTGRQLLELARKNNISVASPIHLENPFRFRNTALKHLERNFMQQDYIPQKADGTIQIFEAQTIYDECNYVCRKIKNLMRTSGYRCRDIAIIARDLEPYRLPLEHAFRSFGIPYYEDERQPIDSQPLVNLVHYAIRAVNYGFQTDDLLGFAKTSLLALSSEAISALENYVILWKLNGKKWISDFEMHPSGFVSEFTEQDKMLLQDINQTRRTIILPLLRFKKAVESGTGRIICTAIYQLLTDVKADAHLLEMARQLDKGRMTALAEEQNRVWDLFMNVLDQIVLTIGEEPVDLKEFEELFQLIISFQDLGRIPHGLDNIIVGTADRTIADSPRIVFLLGLNEGVFPKTYASSGLLNDGDRHLLSDLAVELFSDTSRLTMQEKFIAYSAFTLPSEKLYLSYFTTDVKGNELLVSSLIGTVQQLFSDIHIQNDNQSRELDFIEGEQAAFEYLCAHWEENTSFVESLKAYFNQLSDYTASIEAVKLQKDASPSAFNNRKISTRLFQNNMLLSASRAETYYHCPFLYFCKFGLGAKPRKVAQLDPMQAGTVIHYVLEKLLSAYGSDGLVVLSAAERKSIVNNLLETYLEEEMGLTDHASKRFRYLFLRLQKTINLVITHMSEEFSQSEFKTKAYELKIDNDSEVDPMVIDLPDGGSLAIRGSVDRVDVMEKGGKKYLRVVDYKSGTKEFSLSDVLSGLNMQMLIYLFCISGTTKGQYAGMKPTGVLYMPVRRSISSLPREAGRAEILSNAAKDLKMKGILLNDIDVLKGMERDLKGKFLPVKSGKEISGSLISAQQLGKLAKQIESLLAEMGQNLHDGKIPMAPVEGKNYKHTCDYCDYKSVCVNKLQKTHRILQDDDHDKALQALEGEEDDA